MYHVLRNHVTRRRLIASTTTLAIAGAGLTLASRRATAQVDGSFAIDGGTFTPDSNVLERLFVTASGGFRFSGLDADAAEWRVYLLVDQEGNPGDWEAVGMVDGQTTGRENSGTYAIRGAVTNASHYGPIDVSDGEARELAIPVSLMLMVRSAGGDTLASAETTGVVNATVEPGGSVTSVDATGQLHGIEDGEPTPTLPGGG